MAGWLVDLFIVARPWHAGHGCLTLVNVLRLSQPKQCLREAALHPFKQLLSILSGLGRPDSLPACCATPVALDSEHGCLVGWLACLS